MTAQPVSLPVEGLRFSRPLLTGIHMPTQVLRFPSATDGFIPEATGQVISYSKKPELFPHLRYVQFVPAPQPIGVYSVLGRDEFVRIVADAEKVWEDGDEAPQGQGNQLSFFTQEFACQRRAEAWRLGYIAMETADRGKLFRPKLAHMQAAVNKILTNRSNRIVTLITGANWGTHSATAVALNGGTTGFWDKGSSDPTSGEYLNIWKSLMEAARRIHLDTNGVVSPNDLRVIIGPDDAIALSQAPEVVDYVKQQITAVQLVEDGWAMGANRNENRWNLPTRYKGFELIVDDTVIVDVGVSEPTLVNSANPLHAPEAAVASPGRHYVWPKGTAVLCSRIGGLNGEYGAPSFSTIQVFHYGGLLEVKAFDDPQNERIKGRVQEYFVEKIVSNLSGFRITSIHS